MQETAHSISSNHKEVPDFLWMLNAGRFNDARLFYWQAGDLPYSAGKACRM